MQTFLPYASFEDSAEALDQKRLGKQRVETLQIMTALILGKGWLYHPAVKMWAGYERALLEYQDAICFEWKNKRGYKDTCFKKTHDLYYDNVPMYSVTDIRLPPWLGDEKFHTAHQSNLIRKDKDHYGPLFPGVPDDLEYVWPV